MHCNRNQLPINFGGDVKLLFGKRSMSNAPIHEINMSEFTADPYDDLMKIREGTGAAFVPQMNATLFCHRETIYLE